jgi:hypothetical protein
VSLWALLLIVGGAGAVGGIVNVLLSDNQGFVLPQFVTTSGTQVFRPGAIGNIVIGAVAAGISWGLYGPFATSVVAGPVPAGSTPPTLALAALVGAVLVGIGGARWLTNEVDKNVLRAAASNAASRNAHPATAAQMGSALPTEVLRLSTTLPAA